MAAKTKEFTPWHVSVAAEAIVAAQFARLGYDVAVQYGANQPEYDLIITKGDKALKVSVKGSQDGSWGLTQSLLKKGQANYHDAIDSWLARHKPKTVLCFVQFIAVAINEMPRVYLATPDEVAKRLKATVNGRGDSILYENKKWTKRGAGYGTIDKIPAEWIFTKERVETLLN